MWRAKKGLRPSNVYILMSNILYLLLLLSALFLGSCQKSEVDAPLEDYDRLFPFKGAEKPRISYEDQNIRLGDPDAPVSSFVYPGVKITEDLRTYRVTLTCSFKETDFSGKLVAKGAVDSRYVVRYVGADQQLHTISTSERDKTAESHLTNGDEHSVTFEAKSGHPMYLLVNGVGPFGSSIKASISAVSEDGFTIVRPLEVQEHQNDEGIAKIKHPFCGYIILP